MLPVNWTQIILITSWLNPPIFLSTVVIVVMPDNKQILKKGRLQGLAF